jgi:MFS family permease
MAAVTRSAAPSSPRASPFASLADRPFRWWFTSQVLSASGLMTQSVAAAWLVLQLTGSGVDLALLSVFTMLPVLLGSASAGALIDRIDVRKLLIATQVLFICFSTTLFMLTANGRVTFPLILALSALTGIVTAADSPGRQIYVLELVGRERLVSAVSLYEVVLNASRVIGPGVGGALLALDGPAACFAVNALSFLPPLAVLVVQRRRASARDHAVLHRVAKRSGTTRAGLRYAWSVPEIRACLVLAAATGPLFNPAVLFPLFARHVFHLNGGGYGGLVAAFGLGALPGALVAARAHGESNGRNVARLAVLTAAATGLVALSFDLIAGLVAIALLGFTSIWFMASANTLVQLRARPDMRGRVMGAWTMATPGMGPFTAIIVGSVADWAGVRTATGVVTAILFGGALYGWRALHQAQPNPDPLSPW